MADDAVVQTGADGRDAKHPASILAGPYGHPFHPILVTIPIGAWVASFAFDLASRVLDDGEVALPYGSKFLIAIGLAGALAAAAVGLLDLRTIPPRTKAHATALAHAGLNSVVLVLFAISLALRLDEPGPPDPLPVVLSGAALVVLGASGYLGGKLAYTFGVRVVSEDRQADGLVEKAAPAPRAKGSKQADDDLPV